MVQVRAGGGVFDILLDLTRADYDAVMDGMVFMAPRWSLVGASSAVASWGRHSDVSCLFCWLFPPALGVGLYTWSLVVTGLTLGDDERLCVYVHDVCYAGLCRS